MNILVTGGAGYIGSHTCIALYEQGYNFVIVDDFSNSQPNNISKIERIINSNITYYKIDVKDTRELEKVFQKHSFDAVIHFAGFKSVFESVKKPIKYYHNNITSTVSLLSLCEKYKVKTIIFSSSAAVYGNNISPMQEDFALSATNPYAETKIMCETIIRDFSLIHPEYKIIILRYFNPVGAHSSGMIGDETDLIPDSLMPYLSKVASGKLKTLNIYGSDYDTKDGTAVRDFIHVMDLAEGHVKSLKYQKCGIQHFNLGTGKGISVLELVEKFMMINKVEVPFVFADRREGDLPIVYAEINKATKYLNWRAQRTIEEMCRDSWNFEKMKNLKET